MRIASLFFTVCLSLCLSCSEDCKVKDCATGNPLEDLNWLKTEIARLEKSPMSEYAYIKQGSFHSETVFIIADCCPNCDSVYRVYNCKSESLGVVNDGNIGMSVFDNAVVIWKSTNSVCNF